MKSSRRCVAALATLLMAMPGLGQACSPPMTNLYDQLDKHSTVFLGTVKEQVKVKDLPPGRGAYKIFIDEVFKGLPDKPGQGREIEVTVSENEQCGLGKPKKMREFSFL